MYENNSNCWVQDHNGAECQSTRVGVFGVEICLWKNEDGSLVKGVQATPLCQQHKQDAERDGVLREVKELVF
jgi:hypothetical protein